MNDTNNKTNDEETVKKIETALLSIVENYNAGDVRIEAAKVLLTHLKEKATAESSAASALEASEFASKALQRRMLRASH